MMMKRLALALVLVALLASGVMAKPLGTYQYLPAHGYGVGFILNTATGLLRYAFPVEGGALDFLVVSPERVKDGAAGRFQLVESERWSPSGPAWVVYLFDTTSGETWGVSRDKKVSLLIPAMPD